MMNMSQFVTDSSLVPFGAFPVGFAQHPMDFMPNAPHSGLHDAAALQASFQMDPTFAAAASLPISPITPIHEAPHPSPISWNPHLALDGWHDVQATLNMDSLARLNSIGNQSPSGSSFLEVLSLPGSHGEGWSMVDLGTPIDFHSPTQAIFNPGQTLHLRSNSDSSDGSYDLGSYEDIGAFRLSSPYSPSNRSESEHSSQHSHHQRCFSDVEHGHDHSQHHHDHDHSGHSHGHTHSLSYDIAAELSTVPTKTSTSTVAGPSRTRASGSGDLSGSASPVADPVPGSRKSLTATAAPRKSPIAKPPATKTVTLIRRTSKCKEASKDGAPAAEKKVGRRRGPLRPEQRKQASEIRKLRACLRCKFLKKTCDTGEPCTGCQPSHARLWQVPCTRIDIKDIAYFMKDWKADYARHMGRAVSVYNVKGFSEKETLVWITHGFGYALPVMVREVFVADDSCFDIDWIETSSSNEPIDYQVRTDKLDVGQEGISTDALSEYLDKHVDGAFEDFVDEHFDGTPFVSEIFKTAHRYYLKEKSPVIRKALKLVVAYNLTLHITLIESSGSGSEAEFEGGIDDEYSRFHGKTVAPTLVNYQIKCAMADMWRELQKSILEELSSLYSSVYSGDRLKNWPTIFLLAAILLAVWEEIEFDSYYRIPDPAVVRKFCNDMESTPVGVIVGLFHAISQKLPPFLEWRTADHGHVLNNNVAICEAITEVREHVTKHGK